MVIELAGEEVVLIPERAAFWTKEKTLILADTHFGKDATLRANGAGVPTGILEDDLRRLSTVIEKTAAERLWILGDVFDSEFSGEPELIESLDRWTQRWHQLVIEVVPGNHDLRARDLLGRSSFRLLPDNHMHSPWRLRHLPDDRGDGFLLCGHLHPGVTLTGPGRDRLRLPCFVESPGRLLFPAFGGLTGLASVVMTSDDRVYALAETWIIEVTRRRSRENFCP